MYIIEELEFQFMLVKKRYDCKFQIYEPRYRFYKLSEMWTSKIGLNFL